MRKLWNGFIYHFIKSGFWIPALLIVLAGITNYIWGIMIVAYFVVAAFGAIILFVWIRHFYYLIFKKGYYERPSDKDSEG